MELSERFWLALTVVWIALAAGAFWHQNGAALSAAGAARHAEDARNDLDMRARYGPWRSGDAIREEIRRLETMIGSLSWLD